jgi:plasmid stability protein
MKNITITLDPDTAQRVRVRAAERNMSVSRYIGELLRKDIRESREYEEAMREFFSRGPYLELAGPPQRYATREELHDRSALRGKP